MEKVYAQALMRALEKGTDEQKLVRNLKAQLETAGRLKLLPGILRELRAIEARRAKLAPQLETASESEKAAALKEAQSFGIEAKEISVNPSLIRGWRGRAGGTFVDRSGKKSLIELYRNIITN